MRTIKNKIISLLTLAFILLGREVKSQDFQSISVEDGSVILKKIKQSSYGVGNFDETVQAKWVCHNPKVLLKIKKNTLDFISNPGLMIHTTKIGRYYSILNNNNNTFKHDITIKGNEIIDYDPSDKTKQQGLLEITGLGSTLEIIMWSDGYFEPSDFNRHFESQPSEYILSQEGELDIKIKKKNRGLVNGQYDCEIFKEIYDRAIGKKIIISKKIKIMITIKPKFGILLSI